MIEEEFVMECYEVCVESCEKCIKLKLATFLVAASESQLECLHVWNFEAIFSFCCCDAVGVHGVVWLQGHFLNFHSWKFYSTHGSCHVEATADLFFALNSQ